MNPIQTAKLYGQVLSFAGLTGTESVWDLYCGVGTISLFLAAGAGKVFGVEVIPEAIEDAKRNAAINGLTNVTFETGRAEDVLPARAAQLRREAAEAAGRDAASAQETTEMTGTAQITGAVDVVVVDPPRKGLDRTCIDTILQVGPKKVVYVSCDPATLARDLKIFAEGGYELRAAQPVDMFPHTVHIETVCLLSKLSEAKNHISVKVDMDEMDLTAAESKATYQEIQEWVQEKYGFHVSHLNIAKTKRKCGIIERQNYNLPKSDESRSPETLKEKEEAIIEAFKAFQMIKP